MNSGRRRPRRAAVAVLLSCTLLWLAGVGCSGAVPKPVPPAKEAEKGASAGRMRNLLARILFLEGKTDDALARAWDALEANRKAGVRGEEANSLRLLGDIAAASADRKAAEGLFLEALSIDKETAESGKIASDLRALGAVAEAQGDTARALAFHSRAVEVSRNGDDPKEAAAALLEMARLHEVAGSPEKAKSALAEREKLLRANDKK